jgi:hypothetical protein
LDHRRGVSGLRSTSSISNALHEDAPFDDFCEVKVGALGSAEDAAQLIQRCYWRWKSREVGAGPLSHSERFPTTQLRA